MMPALSPFMTEGTITKWFKKEGESFIAGDVLLQIESDVASLEVQAEMPGILGKILIPDGTSNVPVERVLATVARDAQELDPPPPPRLRPVPPPLSSITIRGPRSAYVEIPTPISATCFPEPRSARLPESPTELRRPSLHFYHPLSTASRVEPSQSNASFLHSATHRSSSGYDPPPATAVGETRLSHRSGSTSASVREMIMDHHQSSCPSAGLCESGSTVGCEGNLEVAGQDLRRKILQNFSKGSQGSNEYFSGIL